jgi:poly(3-hydroxybutyrate) depolymerase
MMLSTSSLKKQIPSSSGGIQTMKQTYLTALCVLFCALTIPTPAQAENENENEIRTWTSTSGTTIEGSLSGISGRRVTIKKTDGKSITVNNAQLNKEDRAYVFTAAKKSKIAKSAAVAQEEIDKLGLKPGTTQATDVPKSLLASKCIAPKYQLYLPQNYVSTEEKLPLVLFLHGMGERGEDPKMIVRHGPPRDAVKKKRPFILIAPQCKDNSFWVPSEIMKLIEHTRDTLNVDEDRIYITGLSMGGYGTWSTIAAYPDTFAGAIPICGGGNPLAAKEMKKIPIWVFHGDADSVVKISQSQRMVDAVKKHKGNIKFTIYPGVAHNSWSRTYANQKVWDWLLTQKR